MTPVHLISGGQLHASIDDTSILFDLW